MSLTDVFLLIVICWAIGAGTLAHDNYTDEREYESGKLKAALIAASWFCVWWAIFAWKYWVPKIKARLSS